MLPDLRQYDVAKMSDEEQRELLLREAERLLTTRDRIGQGTVLLPLHPGIRGGPSVKEV